MYIYCVCTYDAANYFTIYCIHTYVWIHSSETLTPMGGFAYVYVHTYVREFIAKRFRGFMI